MGGVSVQSTDLSCTERLAKSCSRHQSGAAYSSPALVEKSKSMPPWPFVRVTSTPIPCVRYCHPVPDNSQRPRYSGWRMSRGELRFNSVTRSSAAASRCSIHSAIKHRIVSVSGGGVVKADNGQDHRARTVIVASKHARKPGFACIRLLCRAIRKRYRLL